MTVPVRSNIHRPLLLLSLFAGFFLRLFNLGSESFWYDEAVSVYLAGKSVPDLIAHTVGDIHPPGYYLLLLGWRTLAQPSQAHGLEFLFTWPGMFAGLLIVALLYPIGRRLFGPKTALIAVWLAALSPFQIWYSQEVRMYSVAGALGLLALWSMLQFLDRPAKLADCLRGSWDRRVVYALLFRLLACGLESGRGDLDLDRKRFNGRYAPAANRNLDHRADRRRCPLVALGNRLLAANHRSTGATMARTLANAWRRGGEPLRRHECAPERPESSRHIVLAMGGCCRDAHRALPDPADRSSRPRQPRRHEEEYSSSVRLWADDPDLHTELASDAALSRALSCTLLPRPSRWWQGQSWPPSTCRNARSWAVVF